MELSELYARYTECGNCFSTDSRLAAGLFFALSGARFDGHDFVEAALSHGARYAVVERVSHSLPRDRQLVVPNVEQALQQLATHHRNLLDLKIIALTGTNGKTTTKELLLAALSTRYRVAATQGNLNNHLGVPQTLLSFTTDLELGIVEMGANHPGEIDFLCRIALPDYGLITNVGHAHLEGFGSFEGVKRTKAELYRYFPPDHGTIFYNLNDTDLTELARQTLCSKVGYQTPFENVCSKNGTLYFQYQGQGYHTQLVGTYNIYNIAAALAVSLHLGVEPAAALNAIAAYTPANNRSQIIRTAGNTLFMDAYNANPSSMNAAITNFDAQPLENKTYILGDMKELGQYAIKEHTRVIDLLVGQNAEEVYLVGEIFSSLLSPFNTFPNTAALKDHLSRHPLRHRNILIKGSHSTALESLTDIL